MVLLIVFIYCIFFEFSKQFLLNDNNLTQMIFFSLILLSKDYIYIIVFFNFNFLSDSVMKIYQQFKGIVFVNLVFFLGQMLGQVVVFG